MFESESISKEKAKLYKVTCNWKYAQYSSSINFNNSRNTTVKNIMSLWLDSVILVLYLHANVSKILFSAASYTQFIFSETWTVGAVQVRLHSPVAGCIYKSG